MLEEFRNKKVKILIGSNSGVALGTGAVIETSIITMIGIITDYDNELIKLSNSEMISANQAWLNMGFTVHKVDHAVEKSCVTLINRKNVITISLI